MQTDNNRSKNVIPEASKINLNIRYSSSNVVRITIFQNLDWRGDMVATELLGPDDRSLKRVSKLERKIASVLAKQACEAPREWVHWVAR